MKNPPRQQENSWPSFMPSFLQRFGSSPAQESVLPGPLHAIQASNRFYFIFLTNQGTSMRKQSITIPKGCILAFRVIQVTIKDAEWGE